MLEEEPLHEETISQIDFQRIKIERREKALLRNIEYMEMQKKFQEE
jgi:hypothetical protein